MQKTISIISLDAIENNARIIRKVVGERKFFAVVKADAYGHGAERVSQEIERIVDGFCVAIVDEGVCLRLSGITKPVLVFCPPLDQGDVERCAFYNLTPTVNSVNTAKLIKKLPCHLKINSGMNRYGIDPKDLPSVLKTLSAEQIEGVYSHLYAPQDKKICAEQLKIFEDAESFVKVKNKNAVAHLSASAGIFLGENYLKDGVRCGILLYGYPPQNCTVQGVKPALKVLARKVQSSRCVGRGAGYFVTDGQYKTLSAYRLGYADGFLRNSGLGVGNLCMDAFLSERTDDLITVFDDAEKTANHNKTITYETLCQVTARSEKIYER